MVLILSAGYVRVCVRVRLNYWLPLDGDFGDVGFFSMVFMVCSLALGTKRLLFQWVLFLLVSYISSLVQCSHSLMSSRH